MLLCISFSGIALSFIVPQTKRFELRWLFGVSISLVFIAIGIILTNRYQSKTTFIFKTEETAYKAEIVDSPKQKENSLLLSLYLPEYDRKIAAYIETTPLSEGLKAGDGIFFFSRLEPFRAYETPNNFDYAQYMHNKRFSASTYISAQRWDTSHERSTSLKSQALNIRSTIINFYKSLDLSEKEFAILSALTIGYKDSLLEDTIENFRISGTAHLLAISGLHVGILFLAFSLLLSFIKNRKRLWIKYILIILMLWLYVFIIGLPASAVRACIMISLFCVGLILNRRRVAFNTLSMAALFMLLYNPLWLFDISFQFSFSATAFIIWLQPRVYKLIQTKNIFLRYLWNTFSISVIAQLGTFPLAIYYFGYFPTYFFLSNLFIISLATGLIYIGLTLLILSPIFLLIGNNILHVLVVLLIKIDISLITNINSGISSLPFSQTADISIDTLGLYLIYFVSIFLLLGFIKKRSRLVVYSLVCLVLFSINLWHTRLNDENKFSIYYGTDIRYNIHGKKFKIAPTSKETLLELNNTTILFLSENLYGGLVSEERFRIDYLILSGDNPYSIYDLIQVFRIQNVILDSSLSKRSAKKLAKECQELGISHHDIRENDAFHIFF